MVSCLLWTVLAVAAYTTLADSETHQSKSKSKEVVLSTNCEGKEYVYKELAGYGFIPGDTRDKFGDTFSIGSSITIESWEKKDPNKYEGKLFGLPDRGWNTQGTVNFQPRIHEFKVIMTLSPNATAEDPSPPNISFEYKNTVLLKGPDGEPATALDADQTGGLEYLGFPLLPAATFSGDGFGGDGPGGRRVAIDPESLVLAKGGEFWIGDEYGPNIYKFDKDGKMILALRPPDAIVPIRNDSISFASNNPPLFDLNKIPNPKKPVHGRQNNQGFEGVTMSPDGKSLFAMLQSATSHEGGKSDETRRHTRLLQYSIQDAKGNQSTHQVAKYKAEYVVPLPTFTDANGNITVAAQSEIHFVSDTQFLFLPRDSDNGRGQKSTTSIYRHVDIFDISKATNIKGDANDGFNSTIASPDGVLNSNIKPAIVCSFIDFNINAQLNKFGAHNGGEPDAGLLNEKWEGLALVPVDGNTYDKKAAGDEYFLFASSDNDFITQKGFMNFGQKPFADDSGFNLDNQMLVFRINLPRDSKPLIK